MSVPKSQLRLEQITSSLPQSTELALSALPAHTSLADTLKTIASSVRRLNSWDETGVSFYSDAQVFKAMGAENKFVLLNNQTLYVSSSAHLGGSVTAGNSITFNKSGDQVLAKSTLGDLTLSGSSGDINLIDQYAKSSTWSDKNKGIPLSTSAAEWSALQALGITSIIAGLGTSLTSNKYIAKLSSALSAGSATSLNMDFTYIPDPAISKRVDVFLNGVLLNSGSSSDISSGAADYTIDKSSGVSDVEVKFSMDLESDDIVTVTIR